MTSSVIMNDETPNERHGLAQNIILIPLYLLFCIILVLWDLLLCTVKWVSS